MAKQSGLGDNFYVAGVDCSGDINSLDHVNGGPTPGDFTDITLSAFARKGLKRDGGIGWTNFFNPSSGSAHDTFRALPTADVILSYLRGTGIGSPAACCVAKQPNYDGTRADDGMFMFKVDSLSTLYGLEWGRQLTIGKRTDTTATAPATGYDQTTVSTAFGWQAWLHVFAFTGTSVTVTLQDSADNSAFANLTGAAFTAATGVTSQRLEGGRTATVRRYIKVNTTGTFTNAVFAVVFTRNDTDVQF